MLAKVKEFVEKHKYKIMAGVGVLGLGCYAYKTMTDESEIKLSHFLDALKLDHVEEVVRKGDYLLFRSNQSDWYRTVIGRFPIQELERLILKKNVMYEIKEETITREMISFGVGSICAMLTIKEMMKEIQKPEISNTNIQPKIVSNQQTFDDYYGGDAIKVKFKEIIDFLKQPQKYEKMGARIRRGVLFHGPPGTGKTMLARALANEAGCEFIKVVASQFQQMFVGVGAKRVRELFAKARACPNGCIIFVDEIDALGSRLNHLRDSHETTSTINQFLSQMDGFSPTDKIVIVAATNRLDLVDYAIQRAGRFDIKVHIPLPNTHERRGIFQKVLNNKCKNYELDERLFDQIAVKSQSWCGADLQNLINQSIYKAIRQKSDVLRQRHILSAFKELRSK